MNTKLFVGSLAYDLTEDQVQALFAEAGTVLSTRIILNPDTKLSKGFAFVEMSNEEEAREAIRTLNGREVEGRRMTVNLARPMADRSPAAHRG